MGEIQTVKELLDRLREPKEKHSNPFIDLIPEAQELLGLGRELDSVSLEALLIQAIIYCIFNSEKEPDKISKDDAKKRDTYLLVMGLLKDYYHTRDDGTHYTASLRHKNYLAYSQYIEISYGKDIYLGALSKECAYGRAKATLSTTDKRCREDLADFLFKSENCHKCLKKGSQNFIKKVELSNKEVERRLILPEARYTLNNFPSLTEQKMGTCQVPTEDTSSEDDNSAGKTEESGKTEGQAKKEVKELDKNPEDKPAKQNPPKPHKTAVWLKVTIAALIIVVVVCALAIIEINQSVNSQKTISSAMKDTEDNQKPYSIKFRNPDEWLPLGKSYYLTVDPKPSDGTLEGLRCESKNPDIIEILSEPELHIKAIEESDDSKECNVRIKAYMSYDKNIKDEMTVHVIKDGQNQSTGEGKLDDNTLGNSNQKVD